MAEPIESRIESQFESLFEELIQQQNEKVLRHARLHIPHLTGDDILNPHDYPQLMTDPIFNYEEGLAAGLMAAQVAVRARILRPLIRHAALKSKETSPGERNSDGEQDD